MTESEILELIIEPALHSACMNVPGVSGLPIQSLTPLFGSEGALLDSLNLIQFIFILEDEIKRRSGREIRFSLADFLYGDANPFSSVGSLSILIQQRIEATRPA